MPVASPLYPVSLVVAGHSVLVVGGGDVAARKVEGLLVCGAVVHVVAPSVGDAIRQSGATWEERPYRAGDVEGRRLVFVATDDPDVNRAVHDDADAAGIWVNSADDPDNCTLTLPAVARRGPITVAVSTGGSSPALAGWLRDRIERELGPEYEALVELLAGARDRIRAAGGSTEQRDWQNLLDSGILEWIRAGKIAEARERLEAWL